MKQSYRIIYNSITNYGRALLQGFVSFLLIPYIVHHIGSKSYGVVLLSITIFSMVGLFGSGLIKAVIKYFAEQRALNNQSQLIGLFNNSLIWFLAIGILGSLVATTLGLNFSYFFTDIPEHLSKQGSLSFLIMASFIVPILFFDVYKGILSAEQKYDIINGFGISAALLRAISIVIYFNFSTPTLAGVVWIYAAFYLAERIALAIYSHFVFSFLKFSVASIGKRGIKLIAGFATMVLLATMANILAAHFFKFLIGIKLSLQDVTNYGVLLLLTTTANTMVRSLVNVLLPVVSKYQGLDNYNVINKVYIHGTKFAIIIVLALLGITIPFLKSLLIVWMGNEYAGIWIVGIVLFFAQIIGSASVTANQVLSGLGRVKFIAISGLVSSVFAITISWLYLNYWVGAVLFGAVLLMLSQRLINSTAVVVYTFRTLKIKKYHFLVNSFLKPLLIAVPVTLLAQLIVNNFEIQNWYSLFLATGFIEILYISFIIHFVLDKEEKSIINPFIKKIYTRLVKSTFL